MGKIETKDGVETFYAKDRKTWRTWLKKNGGSSKSVWLIIYRKKGKTKCVTYPEAVEEALCFGWIDSKPNKRDDNSYYQLFSKRNPVSNWSKINKDRVKKLIEERLMEPPGRAVIEIAKSNGAWSALDNVEELVLPSQLESLLSKNKEAAKNFGLFPRSVKRGLLEWILNAKTEKTRATRIENTVRLAAINQRANQYKPKSS